MARFRCPCGFSSDFRIEIRNHIKVCTTLGIGSTCSLCGSPCQVLFSYKYGELCPSCAIAHEEPKLVLGTLFVNHMGDEYKKVFLKKAESVLKLLSLGGFSELGIEAVWVTFANKFAEIPYHATDRELIFLFNRNPLWIEREIKTFEMVIGHEIFHHYLRKLGLKVSSALKEPFSLLESLAGSLAEEIQLLKVEMEMGLYPLVLDEVERVNAGFKNLPLPNRHKIVSLSPAQKFGSMISLTLSFAESSWLSKVLKGDIAHRAEENLRIIGRHFLILGYRKLSETIQKMLDEKVWKSHDEKVSAPKRILDCFDEWVDNQSLDLY